MCETAVYVYMCDALVAHFIDFNCLHNVCQNVHKPMES